MFKKIRIMILLYVLLMVAVGGWLARERSTDWSRPLWVALYPVNGDGRQTTQDYIDTLSIDDFLAIEEYFASQAERYRLKLAQPIDLALAPTVDSIPPPPPVNGSVLSTMFWSLNMRYWAWQHDTYSYPKQVQMFIVYFDPEVNHTVRHSLGLQKGLLGVVNAFAKTSQSGSNNVIIAHEMLHIVGATDKYDLNTSLPIYPQGYAAPDQEPLYPQAKAEIMGGRVPISEQQAEIPVSLAKTLIGKQTATEIQWLTASP